MTGSLGPDPITSRNEEGAVTGTSLQQHQEGYTLPAAAPPHNEGKTLAGWAMMAIVTLGVVVSSVGLIIDNTEVAWYAGPAVVVLGLRLAGQGQKRGKRAPDADWYAEDASEATAQ
jgi:hypothetical protein